MKPFESMFCLVNLLAKLKAGGSCYRLPPAYSRRKDQDDSSLTKFSFVLSLEIYSSLTRLYNVFR